ncbi:MAG: DoxX family protein [Actinomycetota bacterium]|nr:DoxX family protein [Actinomycetota bacterium]
MFAIAAIVSILLAALLAFAAVRKLSHRPEIVESYARVGVPEDRLNQLAALLLLGAAGLLAGLAWAPLGAAAAASLIVYFLLAIAAHVRFGDLANLAAPIVIFVLAVAALILRLASA